MTFITFYLDIFITKKIKDLKEILDIFEKKSVVSGHGWRLEI